MTKLCLHPNRLYNLKNQHKMHIQRCKLLLKYISINIYIYLISVKLGIFYYIFINLLKLEKNILITDTISTYSVIIIPHFTITIWGTYSCCARTLSTISWRTYTLLTFMWTILALSNSTIIKANVTFTRISWISIHIRTIYAIIFVSRTCLTLVTTFLN